MSTEEKTCLTGNPYYHPNAKVVGECGQGCCDDLKCPDCGKEWRYEWPD